MSNDEVKSIDDRLVHVLTKRESAVKSNLSRQQIQGQSLQYIEQHTVKLLNEISRCGDYENFDFKQELLSITEIREQETKNTRFTSSKAEALSKTRQSYYNKMEQIYNEKLKEFGFQPRLNHSNDEEESKPLTTETALARSELLYSMAMDSIQKNKEKSIIQENEFKKKANRGINSLNAEEADRIFAERYENLIKRRKAALDEIERERARQERELREMSIPKTSKKSAEVAATYLSNKTVLNDLIRDYDELVKNSIESATKRRVELEKIRTQKKINVLLKKKRVNVISFTEEDKKHLAELQSIDFEMRKEEIYKEIKAEFDKMNPEEVLRRNTLVRLSMVGNHKEEIEQAKMEALKKEKEECTFKPIICESKVKVLEALDENGDPIKVEQRLYEEANLNADKLRRAQMAEETKYLEKYCSFQPQREKTKYLPNYVIKYRLNEEKNKKKSEELEKKKQQQREEKLRQKTLQDFIKNDYETYYKNVSLYPEIDPLSVNSMHVSDDDEKSKNNNKADDILPLNAEIEESANKEVDNKSPKHIESNFVDEDDELAFNLLLANKNSDDQTQVKLRRTLVNKNKKNNIEIDENDEEVIKKKYEILKTIEDPTERAEYEKKIQADATEKILSKYYIDKESGKKMSAHERLYKDGVLRHKFLEALKEKFDPHFSYKPQICRAPNTEILEKVELRFYRNEQKQALHDKKQALAFTKNRLVEKRDSRSQVITKLSESQFANSEFNKSTNNAMKSTVSKKEKAALTTAAICKRLHEKGKKFIEDKNRKQEEANARAVEMSNHRTIDPHSMEIANERRKEILITYFIILCLSAPDASRESINEYTGENELLLIPININYDSETLTDEAAKDIYYALASCDENVFLNKDQFISVITTYLKINCWRREWLSKKPEIDDRTLIKVSEALKYDDRRKRQGEDDINPAVDVNYISNDVFLGNDDEFHSEVDYDGEGLAKDIIEENFNLEGDINGNIESTISKNIQKKIMDQYSHDLDITDNIGEQISTHEAAERGEMALKEEKEEDILNRKKLEEVKEIIEDSDENEAYGENDKYVYDED